MVQRYEKMPTFATLNEKIVQKMEKQPSDMLQKARSYRNVLTTGFRLYTENFRRLFKASWLMALLYAVVCGCLGTLIGIKLPEITVAIMQQLATLQDFSPDAAMQYAVTVAGILGLTLLSIVTMSLASATILNKLKEHKETGSITVPGSWLKPSARLMGRTVKGVFLTLLLVLLPLLLLGALTAIAETVSEQFVVRHLITVVSVWGVYTIIVLLLALPLMHVLMKYVMEAPCGYWSTLKNNYGHGLRHWGSLFNVFFLSFLIVVLSSAIVGMPALILNFANQQAHLGLLMGDPLGMPSYVTPLTFAIAMMCSFLQLYIYQTTLLHNYYCYGSIETKEKERQQQYDNIQ